MQPEVSKREVDLVQAMTPSRRFWIILAFILVLATILIVAFCLRIGSTGADIAAILAGACGVTAIYGSMATLQSIGKDQHLLYGHRDIAKPVSIDQETERALSAVLQSFHALRAQHHHKVFWNAFARSLFFLLAGILGGFVLLHLMLS